MAKKTFWEEEDDKIRFYENLIKMLKQKLFKIGKDDKPEFTGTTSEFKDLMDAELKLMTFKRKRYGY